MEGQDIYYGRGNAEMFDEYMDFINYVFGFNGNSSDFKKLLPKLYKYEYNPAGSSYVTVENGKLKACVGAFDHDISVCGETIKTRGIGNVAVHPYERSRGFMKKLMNMALDDMIADGVELSVLGGRRQRYNYFGFDRAGSVIAMSFNSDNIRHTFGKGFEPFFTFRKVSADDDVLLGQIRKLSESYPLFALRADGKRYYETLVSWGDSVYAVLRNGEFAGYCIRNDVTVNEVLLTDENKADFCLFVRDFFVFLGKGSLRLKLPEYLPEYIAKSIRLAESYSVDICKSFCVLNYRKVADAFMKLAATYRRLEDGELTVSVDGFAGRENLTFSVENGVPAVFESDKPCDISLGHMDAMNLLFAPVDPARTALPGFAANWFPLPLFIGHADTV